MTTGADGGNGGRKFIPLFLFVFCLPHPLHTPEHKQEVLVCTYTLTGLYTKGKRKGLFFSYLMVSNTRSSWVFIKGTNNHPHIEMYWGWIKLMCIKWSCLILLIGFLRFEQMKENSYFHKGYHYGTGLMKINTQVCILHIPLMEVVKLWVHHN